MAFEVTGKLHVKGNTQQISERFQKREFVVEIEDGAYSQFIKFQLIQDRCDLLDPYSEGESLKVSFNLRGKPYNKGSETIYFTNLQAWRLEKAGGNTQQTPPPASPADGFPSASDIPPADAGSAFNDDLPF